MNSNSLWIWYYVIDIWYKQMFFRYVIGITCGVLGAGVLQFCQVTWNWQLTQLLQCRLGDYYTMGCYKNQDGTQVWNVLSTALHIFEISLAWWSIFTKSIMQRYKSISNLPQVLLHVRVVKRKHKKQKLLVVTKGALPRYCCHFPRTFIYVLGWFAWHPSKCELTHSTAT